jgi:hypothetical protein
MITSPFCDMVLIDTDLGGQVGMSFRLVGQVIRYGRCVTRSVGLRSTMNAESYSPDLMPFDLDHGTFVLFQHLTSVSSDRILLELARFRAL